MIQDQDMIIKEGVMSILIKIIIGFIIVLWPWVIYEMITAPTEEELNNK